MSADLEREVWHYSKAKAATKLVILCIADNSATSTREGIVTMSEFMELTGLSRRAVYYNLNKLEEMGEITILGDRHSPAAYRIREYVAGQGYLRGQQLNVYEEHYPQPGNIKDPQRQRELQAHRPKPRRRTR